MTATIGRMAEAKAWLKGALHDGREHWCRDVRLAAERAGLAWRTVQLQAKPIGVVWRRREFAGCYTWRLPIKRRGKGAKQ